MLVFPSSLLDFMGCLLVENKDHLGHTGYVIEEESSGPAGCFTECATGRLLRRHLFPITENVRKVRCCPLGLSYAYL